MIYCDYCGVELEDTMSICPLCGLTVGEKKQMPEEGKFKRSAFKYRISSDIEQMSPLQKRKLFLELSAIILISGIIVTFLINLFTHKDISWSRYIFISSVALLVNIGSFTLLYKRRFLILVTSFTANAMLLLLLDLLSFNIGWGVKIGVPILISLYVLIVLVIGFSHITRRQGFNILAVIFVALGLFLISIEAFLSLYFKQTIALSWSIITGASLMPIAAILLFVHYRLKTGIELRRFFHI